jgi:Zn-dependent protease with chaperone function
MSTAAAACLPAEYFDGRSAQAHAVTLRSHGGELLIDGDGIALRVPLRRVRWPERQRHGTRRIVLDDGGTLRCQDAAAFDAFARAAGAGESITVRVQQSWRGTLVAIVALIVVIAAGYRWGLPVAARGVLAFVPSSVDESIGSAAYDTIASWFLKPTQVAPERRQRLSKAFEQAMRQAHPRGVGAAVQLRFHAAPRVGPNAFALPGGIIVVTDELLQRLPEQDDVVLGVLAHELGHVRQRHGMRLLVQTTLLGAATSVAIGDFSTLLAGLPALLGQLGYSRDFEREADDEAIALLRANGVSPLVMVTLFEVLAQPAPSAHGASAPTSGASAPAADSTPASASSASAPASGAARSGGPRSREPQLGIAFSSHPADAERIARFRAAAAAR